MLAQFIAQPHTHPLTPKTIMVQSPGMGTWLKIALAERNGVAAGLNFPLPSSFIWNLFHLVLPEVPKENNFTKDAMTWKLLHILPQKLQIPAYKPLKDYLEQDTRHTARLYSLCRQIADIYDQYLVFRPEWILAWEQNQALACQSTQEAMDAQPWQADLWRALVQFNEEHLQLNTMHRANLHQTFLQALDAHQDLTQHFGDRIYVLGISSMPLQTLDILFHLSKKIDVCLFHLNPCAHYWGDLIDTQHRARALKLFGTHKSLPEDWQEQLQVGNPLLAHNGKLGREFMDLLLELPTDQVQMSIDAFEAHEQEDLSILQRIQNDMLHLEIREQQHINAVQLFESNVGKTTISPDDISLSIFSCHSPMRELEILQDQLLQRLAADPQLRLQDIVVMMPQVADYAPYIDAVFGQQKDQLRLRYAISDRGALAENPVLQSFLDLLHIHETRFGLSEMMSLLETPAIYRKFNLDEQDLHLIKDWLQQAGVRWGRHAAHREEHQVPAFHQHSWAFGLKRLLLGYAMPDHAPLYDAHLPLAGIEGQATQALGGLFDFIEQLDALKSNLSQTAHSSKRISQLRYILQCFYKPKEEEQDALLAIEETINQLEQQWQQAQFYSTQDIHLVQHFFKEKLQESKVGQRFLAGAINFCTLMPMRAIPFKVVCLLGMNAKDYPRQQQHMGLDLIKHTPTRKGDRSRRHEDRYLFLEALLSAREQLYISFIGHDIRDNTERLPSLLVSELIDYCKQTLITPDLAGQIGDTLEQTSELAQKAMQQVEQRLITQTPLQPFDDRHYQPHHPLQSFSQHWLPLAQAIPLALTPTDNFKIEQEKQLELKTLLRFYRDPCKYFFQRVLKINWDQQEQPYQDDEPFALNALERYQIKKELIEDQAHHDDSSSITQARHSAQGHLPHQPFAQLVMQKLTQDIQPIATQLKTWLQKSTTKHNIQLDLESVQLVGVVEAIEQTSICLAYHPTEVKAYKLNQIAIEHLAMQAQGQAFSFYLADSIHLYHFAPLAMQEAKEQLNRVVDFFYEGQKHPLPFHDCIWDYVYTSGDEQQKHHAAEKSFMSRDATQNLYQNRLFQFPQDLEQPRLQALIQQVLTPLQHLYTYEKLSEGSIQ